MDEAEGQANNDLMDAAMDRNPEPSRLAALTANMLDPLFWQPTRLGVDSAWLAHVPFGHWLVSTHRPASIVELGTRSGVSFSAFCEAVVRCKINARSLAFATRYSDADADSIESAAELKGFLDRRYASFSTLLHLTSEEALEFVPDASVDLLHIDNTHQHESISHTFSGWMPKLSPRAVVLIHDINLRENDRGVWHFWEEVSANYPRFEFFHGKGLGMLLVGNVEGAVRDVCALSDADAAVLRQRFAVLGRAQLQFKSSADDVLQGQLTQLRADLAVRDTQIATLTLQSSADIMCSNSLMAEIDRLTSVLGTANAEIDEFSQEIIALEHERDTILRSTSWRMTAPLRRLAGKADDASIRRSLIKPLVEIGKQPCDRVDLTAR